MRRFELLATVLIAAVGPPACRGRLARPPHQGVEEKGVEASPASSIPASEAAIGAAPSSLPRHLEGDEDWRRGFPPEAFETSERNRAGVVLYIAGMVYMFVAISITCDEFFVPALEVLSDRLELSPDVAGATLMAMGGSAPEFFTSCVGTWIAKTDVGIGTIVGSAVFNVLFVIGACALASPTPLVLTWWPLFRDSLFYTVGLVALTLFFSDESIEWYEALTLFLLYIVYCIFMRNSERIEAVVKGWLGIAMPDAGQKGGVDAAQKKTAQTSIVPADPTTKQARVHPEPGEEGNGGGCGTCDKDWSMGSTGCTQVRPPLGHEDGAEAGETFKGKSEGGAGAPATSSSSPSLQSLPARTQPTNAMSLELPLSTAVPATGETDDCAVSSRGTGKVIGEGDGCQEPSLATSGGSYAGSAPYNAECGSGAADGPEEEDDDGPLEIACPEPGAGFLAWVFFVTTLPIVVTLSFTVPDVRRPGRDRFYVLAFVNAICWVAVFTYLMVWFASITADAFGMSVTLMGLTVLAVGTSVPDFITSVIVAKQGKGDMAVSSSIGSNIFDIMVGLPIPWLSYVVCGGGEAAKVDRSGLGVSIPLLLAMLVLTIATISLNGWVMSKFMGLCMFALYALFMTQCILTEVFSE